MDMAHWPQKPIDQETALGNTTTNSCNKPSSNVERKVRPEKDSAINCPRCNSTNTKFCYYNNYSLSQPRYFCKTCRRYWTEGGSLRNVPVGGGSRKNKRSSSQSLSSVSKKLPDLVVPPATTPVLFQNPRPNQDFAQDLNLGTFGSSNDFKTISELIQVPNFDTKNTTRGMNLMSSFMPIPIPDPNSVYSPATSGQLMLPSMTEFKMPTSISFTLDGMGGNGESSSGKVFFPFEDLMKTSTSTTTTTHGEENRDQNGDSNGFWNGMLGGASW